MKKFRITMMVPTTKDVVVSDLQAAHNEATRMCNANAEGTPQAIVQSIEELGPVTTQEINFEPDFDIPE